MDCASKYFEKINRCNVKESIYYINLNDFQAIPQENDLELLHAEMKLTYLSMSPERHWNGQRLKCTAVSDGFSTMSVSAILRVECE